MGLTQQLWHNRVIMALTLRPLKESQVHAELEHQRLTSLINSMADAVITVDEKAKIVSYNGATLNLLDVNTIRLNSSLDSIFKPIDINNQPADIIHVVLQATLPTTRRDLRLRYDDSSIINLYLSIAPVHLGYGETGQRGFVLLLRDITREKSLEEERDEFISVVSHELRTPIAISEGNISNAQFIAERSGDINAIKLALAEAHNQVVFLAAMINDLSTLSRAERGTLEVDVEAINVHMLCEELLSNYTPDATAKHLQLKLELDPKLELLYSSKLYVREILQNFITNSIKYTQKGHIVIGAKCVAKGIEFDVIDTGIGISKGDQERVFDKFFRSEDYRTRQNTGTGLGLYVTMKLTRLIHADIKVKSELNKGSTFKIFIPNLQPAEPKA
jgi:two-component system, OmpR family, phosphate regulon sensor histidine kinase PhoR